MLARLLAWVRNAFRKSPNAIIEGRDGPGEEPGEQRGGAGVTAPLGPRTPVLVGSDARAIPSEEEQRYPAG
jgi:hypothetical protein